VVVVNGKVVVEDGKVTWRTRGKDTKTLGHEYTRMNTDGSRLLREFTMTDIPFSHLFRFKVSELTG
jgi:hypothetical protein